MITYFYILFFLTTISVYAKTSQPLVTQTEVYIWGSIFFSLSFGSLLLIVHLLPKSYLHKPKTKTIHLDNVNESFEKMSEKDIDTLLTDPSTLSEITSIDTIPPHASIPHSDNPNPILTKVPLEIQSTLLVNFDSVFKMRLLDVENICKEFINNISNKLPYRNTSIYFIKNGKFVCYLEKKNNVFIEYDIKIEKSDLTQGIIQYLTKKLGAFSANHSDAVLPLIENNELFGAIKIQFIEAIKTNDLSTLWREIKAFSSFFHSTYFSKEEIIEEEVIHPISTDPFQNLLSSSFKNKINQSLCIVKVIKNDNIDLFTIILTNKLQKFIKKNIDIFKLNDNMFAFILMDESVEIIEDNIGIFIGELIVEEPSLEICIGCATASPTHSNYNEWYNTAIKSLKYALDKGINKFNFIN